VLASGAQLLATASDATQRGGDVVVGTEVTELPAGTILAADTVLLDGTILPAGTTIKDTTIARGGHLYLQNGLIDVSNTANAANGGTGRLRAPLIGAAYDDVDIDPVTTVLKGASSVTVGGFRVFDAQDKTSGFTGVIDPAGQPGFFGSCDDKGVCSGTLIDL